MCAETAHQTEPICTNAFYVTWSLYEVSWHTRKGLIANRTWTRSYTRFPVHELRARQGDSTEERALGGKAIGERSGVGAGHSVPNLWQPPPHANRGRTSSKPLTRREVYGREGWDAAPHDFGNVSHRLLPMAYIRARTHIMRCGRRHYARGPQYRSDRRAATAADTPASKLAPSARPASRRPMANAIFIYFFLSPPPPPFSRPSETFARCTAARIQNIRRAYRAIVSSAIAFFIVKQRETQKRERNNKNILFLVPSLFKYKY